MNNYSLDDIIEMEREEKEYKRIQSKDKITYKIDMKKMQQEAINSIIKYFNGEIVS